jgi:hypothetical protein
MTTAAEHRPRRTGKPARVLEISAGNGSGVVRRPVPIHALGPTTIAILAKWGTARIGNGPIVDSGMTAERAIARQVAGHRSCLPDSRRLGLTTREMQQIQPSCGDSLGVDRLLPSRWLVGE